MENTSKALLIAAAVLIVILLVAFGMLIFNSTKDVSGDATQVGGAISSQAGSASIDAIGEITGGDKKKFSEMSKEEVNAKFQPYLGNSITATKIASLVELVNELNKDNGEHWKIMIATDSPIGIWNASDMWHLENNYKPYHSGLTYALREFDSSLTYKVTARYVNNDSKNNGYIRGIAIEINK